MTKYLISDPEKRAEIKRENQQDAEKAMQDYRERERKARENMSRLRDVRMNAGKSEHKQA